MYQSASRDGNISLQYGGMADKEFEKAMGGKIKNDLNRVKFALWAAKKGWKGTLDKTFGQGKTALTYLQNTLAAGQPNKGAYIYKLFIEAMRESGENPYKVGTPLHRAFDENETEDDEPPSEAQLVGRLSFAHPLPCETATCR